MRKLHAIATATAMLALCTSGAATAQEKVLRVMNSGGSYGDSIEECVNKPLMEQAGIKVVQESPGGFAKLQAQGRSGVIANTTTDASTGELLRMVAADLVEPPHPGDEVQQVCVGLGGLGPAQPPREVKALLNRALEQRQPGVVVEPVPHAEVAPHLQRRPGLSHAGSRPAFQCVVEPLPEAVRAWSLRDAGPDGGATDDVSV